MVHHEYSWGIMSTQDASWVLMLHHEYSPGVDKRRIAITASFYCMRLSTYASLYYMCLSIIFYASFPITISASFLRCVFSINYWLCVFCLYSLGFLWQYKLIPLCPTIPDSSSARSPVVPPPLLPPIFARVLISKEVLHFPRRRSCISLLIRVYASLSMRLH